VLALSETHFAFEKTKVLMTILKKLVLATLLSLVAANFVASPALATMCSNGGSLTISGTTVTGEGDCVGSVVIPKEVTSIASWAFGDFSGTSPSPVTVVTFEAGSQLVEIKGYAFYKSTNMTSITLPSGLQTIWDEAFAFNYELASINIPSTVTDIKRDAFLQAAKLTSAVFEAGSALTTIETGTFRQTGLQSILIPASVSTIQDSAFSSSTSLKAVVFEGSVAPMTAPNAFYNIDAGAVVYVPSGATGFSVSPYSGITVAPWPNVTFDAQSGSNVSAQQTTSVASAPATSRTGYNFLGWFDAATDGTQITFPYAPSADITLYAQWQQITYNVAFDAQSGTSVALQNTASVATSPTTTQSGFIFQGWFDAATDGNEITFPYAPSADVTLYAQWVSETPAPYSGPLLSDYSDRTPETGDEVVVSGLRLNTITSCTIDGAAVDISNHNAGSFTITIPAGLKPGLKNLVITSSAGTLTVQDALTISAAAEDSSESASAVGAKGWTKKLNDSSAKIYAKDVVGAGKVQIFFNGKEIAWVRATSAADTKLRTANGAHYLVRTVDLVQGRKNALEVYVDGIRIKRVAYSY